MKLSNSLHENNLTSFDNDRVKIYCCGPTVYDNIHIGNARPLVLGDVLVRFFEFIGIKVDYLQNITDIDDKIIAKANDLKISETQVAEKYINDYLEDLSNLNIKKPNKIIPISTKMDVIIDFINKLITKEVAYESKGDVYFDINSTNSYGELSNKRIEELISGSRVEVNPNKRNASDFALWKKTKNGKNWVSNWSSGRPGWHTECVALIDNYFQSQVDIHIGGIDLKFPHHENERIQYLAATKKELSKIWLHNGHVSFNSQKMSKSLGNTLMVKDFIKDHGANVLRYLLLTTNYRQPINLTDDLINQSRIAIQKISALFKKISLKIALNEVTKNNDRPVDEDFNLKNYISQFKDLMQDDLNTPRVITLIEQMIKDINKQIDQKKLNNLLDELLEILVVLGFNFEFPKYDQPTLQLIREWDGYVKSKNFTKADELREVLIKKDVL
ncbi:cysteinyl-tRNA synthetase [Spiroplasma sabaudiense Ar-1343]|uniref:Cysteine--tRNA ligase n=1 Tax=Spiroplasma sabaudiense Ar-1343 TaxID=1276257 RepID=W6A8F3_9MOLU|nr:cysteine--tRNA ligase [Spiroplasma sabaudiense]AHI53443.1 cysteinyl-tRNA synthetase [Spiroplasma sabaudiense Ar-1343]